MFVLITCPLAQCSFVSFSFFFLALRSLGNNGTTLVKVAPVFPSSFMCMPVCVKIGLSLGEPSIPFATRVNLLRG